MKESLSDWTHDLGLAMGFFGSWNRGLFVLQGNTGARGELGGVCDGAFFDAVLEEFDVEVDEESDRSFCELHVCEELSLMNR